MQFDVNNSCAVLFVHWKKDYKTVPVTLTFILNVFILIGYYTFCCTMEIYLEEYTAYDFSSCVWVQIYIVFYSKMYNNLFYYISFVYIEISSLLGIEIGNKTSIV